MCVLVTLKTVRSAIKFGVSQYSPIAMNSYAVIVGSFLGDTATRTRMGDASFSIMSRLRSREALPSGIYSYFGFINHWTKDMHSSLKPCRYAYQLAMEVGDVKSASIALAQVTQISYEVAAKPLGDLIKDFESSIRIMTKYNEHENKAVQMVFLMACQRLRGDYDPAKANELAARSGLSDNPALFGLVHRNEMQLSYLFGDFDLAGFHSTKCNGYDKELVPGHVTVLNAFLFQGLTALALAAGVKHRRRNRRKAVAVIGAMKRWLREGNPNVIEMVYLLEAELAALDGKTETAKTLYKKSIQFARLGRINQALAHERAGRFYLTVCGDRYWAKHHIGCAILNYREWGATAKELMMVKEFGGIMCDDRREADAVQAVGLVQ